MTQSGTDSTILTWQRARVPIHHRILGTRSGRYPVGGDGRIFLATPRRRGNRRDPARHFPKRPPRDHRLCRARLRTRLRTRLSPCLHPMKRASNRLLDPRKRTAAGTRPVGWYHSHTRSEIFLSDADLKIHQTILPGILAGCAGDEAAYLPAHPHRILFPRGGWQRACQCVLPRRHLGRLAVRQMPTGAPAAPPSNEPALRAARASSRLPYLSRRPGWNPCRCPYPPRRCREPVSSPPPFVPSPSPAAMKSPLR